MTFHTLTMQCSGHPIMLLGYFRITYKLILCLTAPWASFQTKGFSLFSFSLFPPSPSAGLSLLAWWASLEQLGQRDLQDSPPLLHNRRGNAGGKQSWEGWTGGGGCQKTKAVLPNPNYS